MIIKKLDENLTVCKVNEDSEIDLSKKFYFIGKTDEEISIVCPVSDVPKHTVAREDGWKGFRIEGILDFSLIGILARISTILAEHKIGIFAVSTYNTDYILVKEKDFDRALGALEVEGYDIVS